MDGVIAAVDRYYVQCSRKSLRIAEAPAQPPMAVVERHPFESSPYCFVYLLTEQQRAREPYCGALWSLKAGGR